MLLEGNIWNLHKNASVYFWTSCFISTVSQHGYKHIDKTFQQSDLLVKHYTKLHASWNRSRKMYTTCGSSSASSSCEVWCLRSSCMTSLQSCKNWIKTVTLIYKYTTIYWYIHILQYRKILYCIAVQNFCLIHYLSILNYWQLFYQTDT